MSDKPKTTLTVRTTQNPTEEVEVTAREYIDLNRLGLIFTGTDAEAEVAAAAVPEVDVADPYNPEAEVPEAAPEKTTTKKKEA